MPRPFVVLMHWEETSPPEVAVTPDWDEALRFAGAYWKSRDGIFDPEAKKPFKVDVEAGYDERLEVNIRKGQSLYLCHANGGGAVIYIDRAQKGPVWPRMTGMTKAEKAWAAKSPSFEPGQRLYAYVDNQPCTIVRQSERYPGHWMVRFDDGHQEGVQWDNLSTEPV